MDRLLTERKTNNQGVNSAGKLLAGEFNGVVSKVNELVDNANKTIYITQEEYDLLVANNEIDDEVEYNVYDE